MTSTEKRTVGCVHIGHILICVFLYAVVGVGEGTFKMCPLFFTRKELYEEIIIGRGKIKRQRMSAHPRMSWRSSDYFNRNLDYCVDVFTNGMKGDRNDRDH